MFMKRYISRLGFLALTLIVACTASGRRTEDPANWSADQVTEWFDHKAWLGQTPLQPDPSIDKKEFAIQYHRNKSRWDKAFAFLQQQNLAAMPVGEHELDGKDVFVRVTEYQSKNPAEAFHETHKNYTDIHFVVSGMEYIGLAPLSAATEKTPYDAAKDIQFHHVSTSSKLMAKPGTFFIFFPGQAHCPGIKVTENALVKKMVIKVRN
jgi:YhcH/YjgK/YiaL family protein